MSKRRPPIIERTYAPSPHACQRALQLLLTSKKAVGRLTSPEDRGDTERGDIEALDENHTSSSLLSW